MPTRDALEQRMDEMTSDMKEMRASMSRIADAMTALAVLEEKNHTTALAVEKIAQKVDRLDERQLDLEKEQVKFMATTDGITKAVKVMWAAFGAGVIYLGGQAFHYLSAQ